MIVGLVEARDDDQYKVTIYTDGVAGETFKRASKKQVYKLAIENGAEKIYEVD